MMPAVEDLGLKRGRGLCTMEGKYCVESGARLSNQRENCRGRANEFSNSDK
jgi:hypothetical protein